MRLLLLVVTLPYVFGAETFCLDGTACPEGTKCCTAHDGQIRCCDVQDSDSGSMVVRSRKTLKALPAASSQKFTNVSGIQKYFSYCIKGVNCDGTCCDESCCSSFDDATCCDTICCPEGYKCCGGNSEDQEEWCCRWKDTCAIYATRICYSKSSIFIPSVSVFFGLITIPLWLSRSLI
ncbi:uncharacterized protein TNCT_208191 [Trichonephila clavata]|uniref:Uncharacterized protein n=1 Tax=Trichonephila clavata TaxID=2740835 RepID=A0A8X6LB02_TRICU|nr:uncharacterized protein TNCT_208191 [Trichonephila clavata]